MESRLISPHQFLPLGVAVAGALIPTSGSALARPRRVGRFEDHGFVRKMRTHRLWRIDPAGADGAAPASARELAGAGAGR